MSQTHSPLLNADSSPDEIFISIVIGTFNGARTIGATLEALESQQHIVRTELIVVDDASTDETPAICGRPNVRLIRLTENHGHGHALNVGLSAARGSVMATLDDDCVPPPTWIRDLARRWMEAPEDVTVIGGSVLPLSHDTYNRRYVAYRSPLCPQESQLNESAGFWLRLRFAIWPPKPMEGPRPVYYVVGANMSVRVSAVRAAGGFTELPGAGEEESIARPLRQQYGPNTIWFFPDLVMQHDFQASTSDSLRRSRFYGRAHGRDWILSGGIPTIRPLPSMLASLLVFTVLYRSRLFWAVLALPLVSYRRWYASLRQGAGLEAVTYPYMHLLEEVADNVGFIEGLLREKFNISLSSRLLSRPGS